MSRKQSATEVIITAFIKLLTCHIHATKLTNQYPFNTLSKSEFCLVSKCCNQVC